MSITRRKARLLSHEKRLSSLGYKLIVGIDEAGRGPLAGPVVAGAVILKDYRFKARIDDSKKLSFTAREIAYDEICRKAYIGIGIISESVIDEINIYNATIRAMELAVADLEISPNYAIVDGPLKLSLSCPVRAIIRGDSLSISIAAASIVAKVTRDRLMQRYDEKYPQYGFARHKGYPTRIHKEALESYGASPIHRKSFAPVKKAIESKLY